MRAAVLLFLSTLLACGPRPAESEPSAPTRAEPEPAAAATPAEQALARVQAAEPAARRDLAWSALAELTKGRVPGPLTELLVVTPTAAVDMQPTFFFSYAAEPGLRPLVEAACGAGEKLFRDVAFAPPDRKVEVLWAQCRPERVGLPPAGQVTQQHAPAFAAILLVVGTGESGGLRPGERALIDVLLAP